jgi:hypothetical protein
MKACSTARAVAGEAVAFHTPPHPHTVSYPAVGAAKQLLKNLTFDELERWCVDVGERCVLLLKCL